jgi:hypothetical protein
VADDSALGTTGSREIGVGGIRGADVAGAGGIDATGIGGAVDTGAEWERRYPFTGCAHSGIASY